MLMHELWAVPGLYRATTAVTKGFFVFVLEIFVGFFCWVGWGGGHSRTTFGGMQWTLKTCPYTDKSKLINPYGQDL